MSSSDEVIKFGLGVKPVDDVIGFPAKVWCTAKKYSVNNTLPIATVNTWLQFSLAYVAAVIITHNNLSYITDIFNSQLMPAYALASVILGTILLTSLAIKHVYKQEIEDEKSKDGNGLINRKIRGGESDGINEIAQNASVIEIVPDLRRLVDKKQGFSIVLPIFGKQGEMLENKKQENRNKIILLTVPYVLGGLIVAGALAKFGFVHIRGWEEWAFIAAVGIVAIVGICVTLSKLKSNEVNNASNIVKKFDNVDILLPWRKGSVVSVMENKFESKEENDPISRLENLLNKHLTDFTDKIVYSFNKHLGEAKDLLDKKLLEPANVQIRETLVHLQGIRGDIKKDLGGLHKEMMVILSAAKELIKKANSLDIGSTFSSLENAIKVAEDKIERFEPNRWVGFFQSREKTIGDNPPFIDMLEKEEAKKIKKELEEELKKVKDELEELKNKQTQSTEPNSSEGSITPPSPLEGQRDEEKKAVEKIDY